MVPEWQEYLQSQGKGLNDTIIESLLTDSAWINADLNQPFSHQQNKPQSYSLLANRPCIADLDQFAILEVDGPDSAKFLQGQLSCHLEEIIDQRRIDGVYCTPQGRTITDFSIIQVHPHRYWLRMHRDVLPHAQSVLAKYIVFYKSQLKPLDSIILGIWGNGSGQCLHRFFNQSPPQENCFTNLNDNVIVRLNDGGEGERFELYLDFESAKALLQHAESSHQFVPQNVWQADDILQGRPHIDGHLMEAFPPQVLNYEELGAINFNKGCYTGQEIVARMHYRGKAKKKSFPLLLPLPAEDIEPLAPLYLNHKEIGQIYQKVGISQNRCLALAILATDAINDAKNNQQAIMIHSNKAVEVLTLPYTVE